MPALGNGLISPAAFRFIREDGIYKIISLSHCKHPELLCTLVINLPFNNGLLPAIKITWKTQVNGFRVFCYCLFGWWTTKDLETEMGEGQVSSHRKVGLMEDESHLGHG